MKNLLVSILLLAIVAPGSVPALAQGDSDQKAVLITGASSGIGRMTAERLAGEGYFVYAGARSQGDMNELNAIDNIMAVRLDVTEQEDIDAAVELVQSEGRGLWGLVNNAGVNVIDPLVESEDWTMEFIFDVNVYGVVRVTRAFAPLIIESKGRIVNTSSISGVLAGGLTGYGFYAMSKHAIEAFTDQLAWEMGKFGVSVSAIEPGSFGTSIGKSRCRRMLADREDRNYKLYAEEMEEYYESCEARLSDDPPPVWPEPVPVAAAIEDALFSDSPKEHYLVVSDPFEAQITIGKLFEELVHLNGDHPESFDRETLIRMLDAAEAVRLGERPRGIPGEL
jgi:NAD(P)-dependent dehydrogenase (short-subunit alcohol dehydrogenase family)